MRLGRRLASLAYWPRQYVVGFARVLEFNGLTAAIRLTALNVFRIRRSCRVKLFGFEVELRSGSPDLAVAIDSLGGEFAPVLGLPDPGGLIIDAGGYIGTSALKLAAAFPASRVVCLEPSRENLALLRRNVAGMPNIAVIEAALAATEGEAVLRDLGSGEWGYSITGAAGHDLGTVPTTTIESILVREKSDRLFLLKLDVEGAERDVLMAAMSWIDRVDILIVEVHEALAPGAEAAFASLTVGRVNTRLPGEKMMSVRRA